MPSGSWASEACTLGFQLAGNYLLWQYIVYDYQPDGALRGSFEEIAQGIARISWLPISAAYDRAYRAQQRKSRGSQPLLSRTTPLQGLKKLNIFNFLLDRRTLDITTKLHSALSLSNSKQERRSKLFSSRHQYYARRL